MSGRFPRQFGPPSAAIAEHLSKPLRYSNPPAPDATPETVAAAVISFEEHRDLTAPLRETRHHVDCGAARDCAEAGVQLRIAELLGKISGARGEVRTVLEHQLEAAHRVLDMVRNWADPTGPLPRAP